MVAVEEETVAQAVKKISPASLRASGDQKERLLVD